MKKKNRIISVQYNQRDNGINIYINQFNSFIVKKFDSYTYIPSVFSADGTYFFLKDSPCSSITEAKKQLQSQIIDAFHIHFDTESLYWSINGVALIIRHIKLCLFISSLHKPCILTIHGLFDAPRIHRIFALIGKFLFMNLLAKTNQTYFLVHSDSFRTHLSKFLRTKRQYLYTIPYHIYFNITKSLGSSNNRKKNTILVSAGYIGAWKGQLEIIDIARRVREAQRNFVLYIKGKALDSSYFSRCKKLIQKLKLTRVIKMKDEFLSDFEFMRLIQSADIYLDFHTRSEHSGSGTIALAIAMNKIVVTTNTFFSRDMSKYKNVFIAKDTSEYAAMVEQILRDNTARKIQSKMGYNDQNNKLCKMYDRLITTIMRL